MTAVAKAKFQVDTLEDEIARLRDLDLLALRKRWLNLVGRPAPKFFRRKFLVRAVAYQMQVAAFGGLSDKTRRRLREIAEAVRTGNEHAVLATRRVSPGTQLIRHWREKTYSVTVLDDGFAWNGARFASLSAIAGAITGTNWNGYAFFGLKQRSKNRPGAGSNANG